MKLPILLKSLQAEEHKEFEKFLQSPFFKSSEQYLKFFRCLCKYYPSFELEKADLQAAYRRCFGQSSLNDTKLYNLMSGLGKQLEQYLVVRMVLAPDGQDQPPLYDYLLVRSLGQRNMGAYFRTKAQQLIDETAARPVKEVDNYLILNQLHQEVYYNPDTPKFSEHPANLQLAVENLDLYYCLSKLRYVAEMKAREGILDIQYEMPLLEAVLELTAAPELQDKHPLLASYHHLVRFYLQGYSEQGFRELMTLFRDKFSFLPRYDQSMLLKHLMNCGISLMSRDCAVESELFSLYKLGMEANLLMGQNRLTHLTFINIVNLASLCKEFDWATAFIAKFSPFLEDSKRQASIDLAMAGIYYYQGMLDKAQTCLTPGIFPLPSFDLLGRSLLLKIVSDRYLLYDKDYEFLISYLHAFERYVQTKQLTTEKKDGFLNCIKFVRKMAATKFEMVDIPESKKESLRKKLKQLQPVVSKKWLEEKIEAL
ncbi:MAG: hypothetical protein H7246_16895 [Phycisphaerae bacterium]|nr:hypothetical protein [Saprospiraceae bacterium]